MRSRLLLLTLAVALLAPLATARALPAGAAAQAELPTARGPHAAWPTSGALADPTPRAHGTLPSGGLGLPAPTPPRPAAGEPVELRVLAGWACVFDGHARVWFTPLDGPRILAEDFYLELGTTSRVELSWSGSASIRLAGATGAFVEPAAQPFGGRTIGFRRLDRADFEVRRGALTVTLPRGQRLLPGGGLFRLTGHPGGRVDLLHHAGDSIELDVGARYTFPLRAGTRRTLPDCIAPPLPLRRTAVPSAGAAPSRPAAGHSTPAPYRGRVELVRSAPLR